MTRHSIVRLLIAGVSVVSAAQASVKAFAVNPAEPAAMIILGASLMCLSLAARRKRVR